MRVMKKMLVAIFLSLVMAIGIPMVVPVFVQTMPVEAAAKIKLNKKKATIYVGKSVQLKIKGTKSKVKWTSNKKSVAKVDSKGKVTGKKAGKAIITAKVGKKKYKCTVIVKEKENNTVSVTNIILDKSSIQLNVGENDTLIATILPNSIINKTVSWSSSDINIATVNNGVVTGISPGNTYITAAIGMKSAVCRVTVKETYTDEEMIAAVWLDFLTKRLRNPDSLQVSDIVIWGGDSSPSLEIAYSAQNAYGGVNKKSMIGSLYGFDNNDNGIIPYIILPNGKYSFPNRRNPKPNGIQLTDKDRRLDINKIKRITNFSYEYNFSIGNNLLGWYENDKLYNEILQR